MAALTLASFTGPGSIDAMATEDNYKRALHRPPPSRFHVEMLPPSKNGSSLHFGMRICPITRSDRSSTSSDGSISSSEYDIWRRWEDCLWFQDTIELEYQRRAKQKKQRLLAGKGIKKNGLYNRDFASSWESLPPGPDPHSVAQNIHAYIPKLTKKGTLFRASQAVVDQRQRELTAFVEGLFQEDPPALLKELRSDRIVTDFFGYWRRDYDLAKKEAKPRVSRERVSITPSILSSYFSPASTLHEPRPSTPSGRSSRASPFRRRASSTSSDSSGSSNRDSNGSISTSSTPGIAEDVPVLFDHNPLVSDRSMLEALPEDRELATKSSPSRKPSTADPRNRNTFICVSPDNIEERSRIRDSWQTTASASTYLEGLNMTLPTENRERSRISISSIATFMTHSSADAIIPRLGSRRSLSAGSRRRRASVQSEALSEGDTDSVLDSHFFDAFPIPSFHLPSPLARRRAIAARTVTSSIHFDRTDDDSESSSSSISTSPSSPVPVTPTTSTFDLDSPPLSPTDSVTRSISTITPKTSKFNYDIMPASPTASVVSTSYTDSTAVGSIFGRSIDTSVPSSPATTIFSLSAVSETSSCASNNNITIKAAHNESIILLRVSRDTLFADILCRIKDKFASQENVPLSDSFTLAIILPTVKPSTPTKPGRVRSNSLSAVGGQMKLILTQSDWERAIMANEGSKITIRVLDT